MTTTVVNFILDRTGSMLALRDETISGFNETQVGTSRSFVRFATTRIIGTGPIAITIPIFSPLSIRFFRTSETNP